MIRPSDLWWFWGLMLVAFALMSGLSGCASKELAREVEALQSWHQGYRDAFEAVMDDYALSYLSAVKVGVDAVVVRTRAERMGSLHELATRRLIDCEAEIAEHQERKARKDLVKLERKRTLARIRDELGQGNEQVEHVIRDEINRISQEETSRRSRQVADARSRILETLANAVLSIQVASEEALSGSRMLMDRAFRSYRQERSNSVQLAKQDEGAGRAIDFLYAYVNQSFSERLSTSCDEKACRPDGTVDRSALRDAMEEANTFVARLQEAAGKAEVCSFNHLQTVFKIGQNRLANLSCLRKQKGDDLSPATLPPTPAVLCCFGQEATNNEATIAHTTEASEANARSPTSCSGVKQTNRQANTGEGRNGKP